MTSKPSEPLTHAARSAPQHERGARSSCGRAIFGERAVYNMPMQRAGFAISLVCAAACGGARGLDVDGRPVDPFAGSAAVTVLAFVARDCPISNQYLPVLQRMAAEYAPAHVQFWLVYPSRSDSPDLVRAHLAAYAPSLRALRDPEHALVERAGVHVTPEVAVFDRVHALAYHGRIDDRFVAFGLAHRAAAVHDLDDAVQATLAGRARLPAHTAAVGCAISD